MDIWCVMNERLGWEQNNEDIGQPRRVHDEDREEGYVDAKTDGHKPLLHLDRLDRLLCTLEEHRNPQLEPVKGIVERYRHVRYTSKLLVAKHLEAEEPLLICGE